MDKETHKKYAKNNRYERIYCSDFFTESYNGGRRKERGIINIDGEIIIDTDGL